METIEQYEKYANSIGCVLSKHAENIIKMVVNNNFQCPCKKGSESDQLCPCPDHINEIQETGSCTCNLFIKGNQMKVFLGGTCNESPWRDALVAELEIDSYNPVVKDWTPECMEEEIAQREKCDFCLYVITPRMTGVYSIAEVVDDSNKRPEKTIFCVCEFDVDPDDVNASITYDKHAKNSLVQVAKMVEKNGGKVFQTLGGVRDYLNTFAE